MIEDSQQEFKDMGFLRLTNGVPSGDTIRRVLEVVKNPEKRCIISVVRKLTMLLISHHGYVPTGG